MQPSTGADAVRLAWRLASDEALTDVVGRGRGRGDDGDGPLRARRGRRPDARADSGGTRSRRPTGRARRPVAPARCPTAPERAAARRRVVRAATPTARFGAYRALAVRDVDLVVHVGDYIYEDGLQGVRAARPAAPLHHARRTTAPATRSTEPTPTCRPSTPATRWWPSGTTTTSPATRGVTAPCRTTTGATARGSTGVRAASQAHDEWVPGRTSFGRRRAPAGLALGRARRPGRARRDRHADLGPRPPARDVRGAGRARRRAGVPAHARGRPDGLRRRAVGARGPPAMGVPRQSGDAPPVAHPGHHLVPVGADARRGVPAQRGLRREPRPVGRVSAGPAGAARRDRRARWGRGPHG